MSRLPAIRREALNDEGQRIWDSVAAARNGVHGPYEVLLRLPQLAERMLELGNYFREQGALAGADRELAIMVAAREMGSRYQWARHEPIAIAEGVRREAIDAVRKMIYRNLTDRELVVVEVVQSLFRTKMLPTRLYNQAVEQLGEDRLVELIALAGFYCSIAFILIGFEVTLPPDATATF